MSHPEFEHIGSIETRLTEECAEVIMAICKVQRFGWSAYNPYDPEKKTNRQNLIDEIDDVEKRLAEFKEFIRSQT